MPVRSVFQPLLLSQAVTVTVKPERGGTGGRRRDGRSPPGPARPRGPGGSAAGTEPSP